MTQNGHPRCEQHERILGWMHHERILGWMHLHPQVGFCVREITSTWEKKAVGLWFILFLQRIKNNY